MKSKNLKCILTIKIGMKDLNWMKKVQCAGK